MVHRMLGNRFGTGGSNGHEYLRVTAARSRIFSDFFNLAGYYIPKVMLPTLPDELREQLGFSYQQALSNAGSPRARADSFTFGAPHSSRCIRSDMTEMRRCRRQRMPFRREVSVNFDKVLISLNP